MAVRIWLTSRPPPMASKARVAPVSTSAAVRSSVKVGAEESHTCAAPRPRKQRRLFGTAHDVHQRHAVRETDSHQHLAEVGRRRGVNQRRVPLSPHGLHHAKRRKRIDEAGRPFRRRGPLRQHQGVGGLHGLELRIGGPAEDRHRPAQQGLRLRSGAHHHAGPLVAHRQGVAHPRGHHLHERGRDGRGEHWPVGRPARLARGKIGRPQQEAQIRRIDRRALDPHHHLVRAGRGNLHLGQRQLKRAVVLQQRP